MNIALTIPLADGWGMHDGSGWWLLIAVPMMLFMGAMMWMMMRGMMGRGSSRGSPAPPDRSARKETPLQTLERRFAEGEISIEEFHARRDALVGGEGQPSADEGEEQLTAPGVGGRQS